jgi:hypothetical protein
MTDEEPFFNMRVSIRREVDGMVATKVWENWRRYDNWYWWEKGNASCNCNRSLFFARARGAEEFEAPCGEGAYAVQISDDDTGAVLYDEWIKGAP